MTATLPAPYYYGPDKYVRFYDDLLKQYMYWPRPMSSLTGNYVTLDLAVYLFQTTPGTELDVVAEAHLPPGVRDTAIVFGDDLQTMADAGNHISQSIIVDGGYSMKQFAPSQKSRRKGLAVIDEAEFTDYQDVTETRQVVKVLDVIDLDQQIHSSVGLSVEQFLSVAATQGILVPYLATFNGRTIEQAAKVSLSTFVGAIMPLILAQLPTQTSPTNPTNPTKTLDDFDIDGIDRIVEGIMDTTYRASVIYSDKSTGFVSTQGVSVDGFEWAITQGQGEQISVTGVCPIHANNVVGDGRTFVLELRHVSLPGKVARKTITIVDATAVPPPPVTTDPFAELFIDADARSIRMRYRLLGGAASAGIVLFRDGNVIYSADGQSTYADLSLSQNVQPGKYYYRVYEPNKDQNFLDSPVIIVKGQAAGASLVTAIDYAHLAKGTDGYPELQLWFKSSVVEDIQFTIITEDQPESQPLNTKSYSDSAGYSRAQQLTNIRGGQLVTVKAWTVSNPGGFASKQFRITAGAARNTVFGAQAPVDTATIIQAIDAIWGADGKLTIYVKTSRADGSQSGIANNAGQYSGWFGLSPLDNDPAGYQYQIGFSPSAAGAVAMLRFRPTSNNAESAIAYLKLTTPTSAKARATVWANGSQIGGTGDAQTGLPALQRQVIRGNTPNEISRCNISLYLDENTGVVYAIDSSNPDKLGRPEYYEWVYFLNDQWLTRDEFHRFPLSRNFPHLVVKILTDTRQPRVKWRWQNIMAWEETQFLQYR